MFNKRIKTFLLLAMIFLTVICISTVSASDDNDVITYNHDDDISAEISTEAYASSKNMELTKNIKSYKKADSEANFTELESDIKGSDVKLVKDYKQESDESNITITEDKIIDANGHTFSESKGLFNINEGVTLTFKNAVISSSHGPTYQNYWWDLYNKGNLIVNNVTFRYASPERTYGGQIWTGANTCLNISDSVFDGEHTVRSQVYADGTNAVINIDNTQFTNYNTTNAAVCMNYAGNLTVTNSVFANNVASSFGGGIFLSNDNIIAAIEGNTFENLTSNFRGGAIYVQGVVIVANNHFKNIKQTNPRYNAGIIWVNTPQSVLYLSNNTAKDIVSDAADIYFSSGKLYTPLYVSGENITVNQEDTVNIIYNVTDDMGNTIDFATSPFKMMINDEIIPIKYGNGTISTSFDASYKPDTYPINVSCDETNLINGTVITDNTLTIKDLGLISYADVQEMIDKANENEIVTITRPVFRKNDEESIVLNKTLIIDFNGNSINAKNGKVFDVTGVSPIIRNVVVTNIGNKDTALRNTEGRLFNLTDASLEVENSSFINNIAPNLGSSASGSFILLMNNNYLKLNNCNVINSSGTFINNIDSRVYIDGCNFENNNLYSTYSDNWNAIIANGGYMEVNNSRFINNTPNWAVIDAQSQLLPSNIYSSTMLSYDKQLVIENTLFQDNIANKGKSGAVHASNDTRIYNSTFINNRNNGYFNYGGAVKSSDGSLNIDSCIFVNNSAYYSVSSYTGKVSASDATAIYNVKGDLNIKNSLIISNITEYSAIYNVASNVNIDVDGNYWGNDTPEGFVKSGSDADEIIVNDWIVLNLSVSPNENVKADDIVSVKATFNRNTDGSQVTTLPDYDAVVFNNCESVAVENNEAETQVKASKNPLEITAYYPNMEVKKVINLTAMETFLKLNPVTDAKYNSNVTVSGTLSDEKENMLSDEYVTLTFNDREVNVTVKEGFFEYTTVFKNMEEQNVKAYYAGSDNYKPSEDNITFTLAKQDVIVTVNNISDVKYGENITLTGKFTTTEEKAISNSNVRIFVNGKKYLARTDKTGTYTLNVKVTNIGENTVKVGYGGNTYYNDYETSMVFNATKQDVIVTVDSIADKKVGENVTLTGTFSSVNGKSISNSNVRIFINGKKYIARTDSTGRYNLTVTITKEGINSITVGYYGNDKYNAYESEVTTFTAGSQDVIITADQISDVTVGENVSISGKFTDKYGKAISNSVVTVKINGKKYLARTDSKGVFILSVVTKTEGVNNVTLSYAGGAKYNAYETETTFNVKA